jgi:hypothetical protein
MVKACSEPVGRAQWLIAAWNGQPAALVACANSCTLPFFTPTRFNVTGTSRRCRCCCGAGPVDGPVLFQDCSNCQVAAACHLFKAQNCTSCEFGE